MTSPSLAIRRTGLHVSGPLLAGLYVAFSLADLVMSLAAFSLGIPEGNPVLAALLQHGLFVPTKLALTGLAAVLIAVLYRHQRVRRIAWIALGVMAAVDCCHIFSLTALLHSR